MKANDVIVKRVPESLYVKIEQYCRRHFPEDYDNHFGLNWKQDNDQGRDPIGILGELAVVTHFGYDAAAYLQKRPVGRADDGYDVLLYENGQPLRCDIKTKETAIPPQDYYEYSVPAYLISKPVNAYIFCGVLSDFSSIFLVGYIKRSHFATSAILYRKGDRQGKDFEFRVDTYNIKLSDLFPLRLLRTRWIQGRLW